MRYEINKENNQVRIKVTIPVMSKLDCPERIEVKTSDVLKILKEEKVKVGNIISDPHVLRNNKGKTKFKSAEWVFEAYKGYKSTSSQRSRKKSKKTLDKTSDHVIIEEYKSSLSLKEEKEP
jgi:hypothetical protein